MGSGAGVPGQYRRNMEAVGEFEQVWGGGRGEGDDSVPLTKELSAEFNREAIQCCSEILFTDQAQKFYCLSYTSFFSSVAAVNVCLAVKELV